MENYDHWYPQNLPKNGCGSVQSFAPVPPEIFENTVMEVILPEDLFDNFPKYWRWATAEFLRNTGGRPETLNIFYNDWPDPKSAKHQMSVARGIVMALHYTYNDYAVVVIGWGLTPHWRKAFLVCRNLHILKRVTNEP